jgi:hypothetical protein
VQRLLDALHRAERILGIEVCPVEATPRDKEFRRRLSIERKDRVSRVYGDGRSTLAAGLG